MPLKRSGGAQYPLELHTGDNVWVFAIGVGLVVARVKRGKPWGKDNSARTDDQAFFLLIKIDGLRGAEFFAGPAFSLLEIDAILAINGIFERDCLGIFDIGGLTFDQVLVERVSNPFRTFFRAGSACDAFVHIHIPWMSEDLYLKISCISFNRGNFSQGDQFDIQVPVDLDQFGRYDSHGTIIGGEGLI